jgi:hypothetical protein
LDFKKKTEMKQYAAERNLPTRANVACSTADTWKKAKVKDRRPDPD